MNNEIDSTQEHVNSHNQEIQLEERILPTLVLITYTSILGLFIRLGLNTLFSYQGQIAIPLLYTQFIGCLILGIITPLKSWLILKHPSLFSSLSSGLCGSITTFSTWNLQAFEQFFTLDENFNLISISARVQILNFISQIILTTSISYFGLISGEAIGKSIAINSNYNIDFKIQKFNLNRDLVFNKTDLNELTIFIIFAICPILILFFTAYLANAGNLTLSAAFAPLGAYLRYLLSRINKFNIKLPIGTLIANLFACIVLAIATLYSSLPIIPNTINNISNLSSCITLYAVINGFCGCLSTVSTFMSELKSINGIRYKVRYFIISILLSQIIFILLLFTPYLVLHNNQNHNLFNSHLCKN